MTLWKELGHLVEKYRTAIKKKIFPICSQSISEIGVTDQRHNN